MKSNIKLILFFSLTVFIVSSCASLSVTDTNKRQFIIRIAKNMLNKQYKYGKQDPSWGFDCSGLTQYAYSMAGIKIPRTAKNQYENSRKISLSDIQPADLLFFSIDANGVSHVGIYIGDNKFIHAPSAGKRIQIVSIDNLYWQKHFFAVGTYF